MPMPSPRKIRKRGPNQPDPTVHLPDRLRMIGGTVAHSYPLVGVNSAAQGAKKDLSKPIRVSPVEAWNYNWIQLNSPIREQYLPFDLDTPAAMERAQDLADTVGLQPNWVVIRRNRTGAQVGFVLRTPVHHGQWASAKPQMWLDSIKSRLKALLEADPRASGYLCRNPVNPGPDYYRGANYRLEPYTLTELEAVLRKAEGDRARGFAGGLVPMDGADQLAGDQTDTSRNCRLFRWGLRQAFRKRITDSQAMERLLVERQEHCLEYGPWLTKGRCRAGVLYSIAKSITRYVREGGRSRGSGQPRLGEKAQAQRDARIVQLITEGKTQREVAAMYGLTQPRICQIWKQYKPSDKSEGDSLSAPSPSPNKKTFSPSPGTSPSSPAPGGTLDTFWLRSRRRMLSEDPVVAEVQLLGLRRGYDFTGANKSKMLRRMLDKSGAGPTAVADLLFGEVKL